MDLGLEAMLDAIDKRSSQAWRVQLVGICSRANLFASAFLDINFEVINNFYDRWWGPVHVVRVATDHVHLSLECSSFSIPKDPLYI